MYLLLSIMYIKIVSYGNEGLILHFLIKSHLCFKVCLLKHICFIEKKSLLTEFIGNG